METTTTASLLETPPLPDWLAAEFPFHRRMVSVPAGKIHFVDHGEGKPVLMVHGNPTWSFLWRKVMRELAGRPLRLIAPDLLGFGLSDKPASTTWHTLERHVDALCQFVDVLGLESLTLVAQDWGGPIGGGMAARRADRIRAAVFGNTALLMPKRPIQTTWFHRLSHWPIVAPVLFRATMFPVPILHRVQGDPKSIDALAKRAYRYPFRKWSDRSGPLALARMVPNTDEHPSMAILETIDHWTRGFQGPVGLVWGRRDPILGRALHRLREVLTQAEVVETDAGHFLQEEVPGEIAKQIVRVAGAA